jgi:hypothetical protein
VCYRAELQAERLDEFDGGWGDVVYGRLDRDPWFNHDPHPMLAELHQRVRVDVRAAAQHVWERLREALIATKEDGNGR